MIGGGAYAYRILGVDFNDPEKKTRSFYAYLRVYVFIYLRVARRVFTSKNAIDNTRFYLFLRVFICFYALLRDFA